MELSQETTQGLRDLWEDEYKRQDAKTVILEAIGQASDITVKVANDVFDVMDDMLIEEKEDKVIKHDNAQ